MNYCSLGGSCAYGKSIGYFCYCPDANQYNYWVFGYGSQVNYSKFGSDCKDGRIVGLFGCNQVNLNSFKSWTDGS